jgi:hypothetical protein
LHWSWRRRPRTYADVERLLAAAHVDEIEHKIYRWNQKQWGYNIRVEWWQDSEMAKVVLFGGY